IYAKNRKAFKVYRVDLESNDSGVSVATANQTTTSDTALHLTYNGSRANCWMREAPDTPDLVVAAAGRVNRFDLIVVIANTPDYGGCTTGSAVYVTAGSPYTVA